MKSIVKIFLCIALTTPSLDAMKRQHDDADNQPNKKAQSDNAADVLAERARRLDADYQQQQAQEAAQRAEEQRRAQAEHDAEQACQEQAAKELQQKITFLDRLGACIAQVTNDVAQMHAMSSICSALDAITSLLASSSNTIDFTADLNTLPENLAQKINTVIGAVHNLIKVINNNPCMKINVLQRATTPHKLIHTTINNILTTLGCPAIDVEITMDTEHDADLAQELHNAEHNRVVAAAPAPPIILIPAAPQVSTIPSLFSTCAHYWAQQNTNHDVTNANASLPLDVNQKCASLMHQKAKILFVADIAHIRISNTMLAHTDCVCSVSFSPDGTKLASGSWDKTIKVWDLTSNTCSATLNSHTSSVYSVSFSPDGTKLASASGDTTIKVWDLISNTCCATLNGHAAIVCSVSFSPDGTKLASASCDTTIKVWDLISNTCCTTLNGHTSSVYSVSFSPDGTKLASASGDTTIKVWDLNSNTCCATLNGHAASVYSVSFSPDGTKLASGSQDNTIKIWDLATNTCCTTLNGHTSAVRSVSFSPDGTKLVSGSSDTTIKVWDLTSNTCCATLYEHTSCVCSVSFSPNGTKLASGSYDKTIKIWGLSRFLLLKHTLENELTIEQVKFIALVVNDMQLGNELDVTTDAALFAVYNSLPDIVKDIVRHCVILPQ